MYKLIREEWLLKIASSSLIRQWARVQTPLNRDVGWEGRAGAAVMGFPGAAAVSCREQFWTSSATSMAPVLEGLN